MNTPSIDTAELLRNARERHQSGDLQQAEQLYRQILAVDPDHAEAIHLMGMLAYQVSQYEAASQLISHAILKDGEQAPFYNNLGLVLQAQGNIQQAAMLYQQAIDLDSGYADACCNLGISQELLGNLEPALASYEKAITINPDHTNAHNSRGVTLHKLGRLDEALAALQQATTIEPDFAEAHNNIGNTLEAQGRIDEAQSCYRHVLALQPGNARAHSNLLLSMNYDANVDARMLFEAHQMFNETQAAGLGAASSVFNNSPEPAKRLRIGYVSADFYRHPVASFIEPILGTHNKQAFEIFCYYNGSVQDALTQRFQALADHWRPILGKSDERVAELIRKDGIDILVDLSGHMAGNRLPVFAMKPAPVQITYLGYPSTTGMAAMDYRLSDEWLDPPGMSEAFHTEKIVRLPKGSLCFRPPSVKLPAGEDTEKAHITFGSFNNTAKLSPQVIALWSKILLQVPGSKLLLKSKSLADPGTVARLEHYFRENGVDADRLETAQWTASMDDHLAQYNQVDIALDTLPYSGCTTTCEALWMGVPVVTLARNESRSRMSTGILRQIGLEQLIADSEPDIVALAVSLANDREGLKTLKSGIRQKMESSSLLDSLGFTRELEAVYRELWRTWCTKNG